MNIVSMGQLLQDIEKLDATGVDWRTHARDPFCLRLPGTDLDFTDVDWFGLPEFSEWMRSFGKWFWFRCLINDENAWTCEFPQAISRLPRKCGIYSIYRPDFIPTLVYVGIAQDVRQRWSDHHKMKDLVSRWRQYDLMMCFNETDYKTAVFMEKLFIWSMSPELNERM